MKKILIVNPPFYRLQNASLIHYPPGCCYVAAVLEKEGFPSVIYNSDYDAKKKTIIGNTNHLNFDSLTEEHANYSKRLHSENDPIWIEIKNYIKNFQPEILILSVFSTTLTAANKIAKFAKKVNPKVITIFEGSTNRGLHCAINPAVSGDFSVMDFALRGEPEITVVELIKKIDNGSSDFSSIKGLSWKKGEKVIHNEERAFIKDLDSLPFPARHLIDGADKLPPHCFQGIYGSRGCPYDCIFCGCHTSMGYKPRIRSAKSMVDEMEYVFKKFGTRYFYVCDDIFFIDKERAREFCKLLLKKHLPIFWSAQTRAEIANEDIFKLAKKAGCQHIAVGVEVGNPEIRKLIRKGNTIEDVKNCAKIIKNAGLRMVAFTMIGLPWEGKEEIKDTVNLIKEIDPYIVFPYFPTPASGTELASIVSKKNPEELKRFCDKCHIDISSSLSGMSGRMKQKEKEEVIEWAMQEFAKVNKKSLILDILKRPDFYFALAHDMGFFSHPSFLFGYFRDYLNV